MQKQNRPTVFQQLWQMTRQDRLPHALLLMGAKGTGKAQCATQLALALLCRHTNTEGMPCQRCDDCHHVTHRRHPNVLWIEPEKPGGPIKVDQVRAIFDFVNQTGLSGEHRFVILHPADKMNLNAAHALLKTLEEPAQGALLILISDQAGHLPATIISRCQRVVFPKPAKEEQLAWMKSQPSRQDLFSSLMLLAESKGNPIESAAQLQHHDPVQLLDFTLTWIVDVLRLQLNDESGHIINQDYVPHLMQLKEKTTLQRNVKLMEYVQQLRKQLCAGIHLNKQMMLEAILISWMECASCFL
jgi:DNA polymerase-3 subunit delta'